MRTITQSPHYSRSDQNYPILPRTGQVFGVEPKLRVWGVTSQPLYFDFSTRYSPPRKGFKELWEMEDRDLQAFVYFVNRNVKTSPCFLFLSRKCSSWPCFTRLCAAHHPHHHSRWVSQTGAWWRPGGGGVCLLATGLKYIWESRAEKKVVYLYKMRAKIEARVFILRKTRYHVSGDKIHEMIN